MNKNLSSHPLIAVDYAKTIDSISTTALSVDINTLTTSPTFIKNYRCNPAFYSINAGQSIEINECSIKSTVNDNKNILLMIETIKNLLIEKSVFTEQEFENEYLRLEERLKDIITAQIVADKLMQ